MILSAIDYIIIALFVLITLGIAWYARRTANQGKNQGRIPQNFSYQEGLCPGGY